MALGTVLIRPQPVAQPLPVAGDLNDVLVDLIEVFARNPKGAAAAAAVAARLVPAQLEIFARSFEEKLRLSDGRIRQVFKPFSAALEPLLAGIESEHFVDVLSGVLEALEHLLAQLTSQRITALLRELAAVLERDLGISQQTLRDAVTTLASQIIDELQADVIRGQGSREAMARYEFGAVLAGFKSLFDEEDIELPELGLQVVIDAINTLWLRGRIDRLLAWLRELLSRRDDLLAPLAAVIEARLSLKVEVKLRSRSTPERAGASSQNPADEPPLPQLGADPAQPIAWYASWVAGSTRRYSADPTQAAHRFNNPELFAFTYKHHSAPTMEKLAFHTAWAMPAVEALVFHMSSLEQGDVLSNLHIMVLDAIDFGLTQGDKGPLPAWWNWLMRPLMTMVPFGFEAGWGRVGESHDAYPWINGLGDFGETLLYRRWSCVARELVMSFCTLRNHDPSLRRHPVTGAWVAPGELPRDPKTGKPLPLLEPVSGEPVGRNADYFEGIAYLFWELGALIVPAVTSVTSRKGYGFTNNTLPPLGRGILVGGLFAGASAAYLSIFLSRVIAGEFSDSGVRYAKLAIRNRLFGPYKWGDFGEGLGSVFGLVFMVASAATDSLIYAYLFTDGRTSGGTYGVDLFGVEREFQGYPSASVSPYRLPFTGMQQCVQGNLGVWSHYAENGNANAPFNNGQLYAYDFGPDTGTEVLCARSGIVTSAVDLFPDNNSANWNSIEVMHLIVNPPAGGLAAVPAPAGITTFADALTPIPAGTLFPPYWDAAGNPLPGMPNPVPLHPSAAILPAPLAAPAYYAGYTGFPAGTTFAFTDPAVDRMMAGVSAPAFSDGSATPARAVFAPNVPLPPPPGTPSFPAGTSFVPSNGMVVFLPTLAFSDGTPIAQNVAFAANTPAPPPVGTPTLVGGTTPAGGVTVFAPATLFSDGTVIPVGAIFGLDVRVSLPSRRPFAGTPFYPAGTVLPGGVFVPLTCTFSVYGHLMNGFMRISAAPPSPAVPGLVQAPRPSGLRDLFESRRHNVTMQGVTTTTFWTDAIPAGVTGNQLANNAAGVVSINSSEMLGIYVSRGRPIGLSGDTGISAYDHLHTMVYACSAPIQFLSRNNTLSWRYAADSTHGSNSTNQLYTMGGPTIPFAYGDASHGIVHGLRKGLRSNGVPRAFTFYDSGNTLVDPSSKASV